MCEVRWVCACVSVLKEGKDGDRVSGTSSIGFAFLWSVTGNTCFEGLNES